MKIHFLSWYRSMYRFLIFMVLICLASSCIPPNIPVTPLPLGGTFGSEYLGEGQGTRFVLYAPGASEVAVSGSFNGWGQTAMNRDGDVFWVEVPEARPGHQYKYRSPDFAGEWIPDPVSRLVTDDASGNSVIVNPAGAAAQYSWGDGSYVRPARDELVIYEMHVIDFTWQERSGPVDNSDDLPGDIVQWGHQGTFAGVADRVEYLAALGVTAVELMPVQEWPGGYYSWGYNPYLYWALEGSLGTGPAASEQVLLDFKEMVDTLHQNGIAVIMDVVYNHTTGDSPLYKINPGVFYDGNTDWGPKLDLSNEYVFAHVKGSLSYFMDEFHIDGFRFDSTENSDPSAMRRLVSELYAAGFGDRYFIFEEFSGPHNSAIQAYNLSYGGARISSWGTGYKDALYAAISDTYYGALGDVTYHSNSYGWSYADSAVAYASSHDEGTLYYHAGLSTPLALSALTHKLTSLGVPMFWMGDEIMRDHRGNSPLSGSGVDVENNQIDWDALTAAYGGAFDYVGNLLHLRKNHPSLSRAMTRPDTVSGFSDGFMWNTDWAGGFIGFIRGREGDRPFAVFVNYGNSTKVYDAEFPQNGHWILVADSAAPAASESGASVAAVSAGTDISVIGGTASVSIPANTAYIYMGPADL
jgi:1,4-alpha-glucan branching enzyme